MDNKKLSSIMYMGAGALFLLSGILGGKMIYLVLGAVFLVLGMQQMKKTKDE